MFLSDGNATTEFNAEQVKDSGIGINIASAIMVPEGYSVHLYSEDNLNGLYENIDGAY